MKNAIDIRDRLVRLLVSRQDEGGFTVSGYQAQRKSSGTERRVSVYYSRGSFPRERGTTMARVQHHASFRVEITVSSPARGNIRVLNDPDAAPGDIASALAAMTDAASEADLAFDEVASVVWGVLMDPMNYDLGGAEMSNRWVADVEKTDPVQRGSLVVIAGFLVYSCQTPEVPISERPVPVSGSVVSATIDLPGDTVQQSGVTT